MFPILNPPHPVSRDWPCPSDLKDGEPIELLDSYGGVIDANVIDTINGIISVSIDAYMNSVCTIDPKYTKWRRPGPQVSYGVRCTDKYCNEWFEHAIATPDFKCYRCRNR